ncbi:TetR/AcrR family transcriptional regulator [Amycolatopsis sp. NBC_00345]|uniref:TetR/AcrR family transcriptional regulator n=1 Tax=Amycolatopsis sp. NBC_00345 TaxID=2975955 RepID=UPI002E273295
MGRWEPNARERLELAALELFRERGYDSTTVAEIATRAGLTKRSFFRHFADKRELLFSGQELIVQLIADAIIGAPSSATPLDAITAALVAFDSIFDGERRALARERHAIIADNVELRERELLKHTTLTTAMARALRERGEPEAVANLAAEFGGLALNIAFARWIEPTAEKDFAPLARQAVDELRATTAALG